MDLPTVATGSPANELADEFGSVVPGPGGNSIVRVEVAAPVGSIFVTMLCSTTPQGAELEHFVFPSAGSLAIDPSPTSAVSIQTVLGTTAATTAFNLNLGAVAFPFLEAEMYLQTWVLRPDGTETVTNRVRIDLDRN